jgi:glucose/arabinose dehydrogenase
MKRVWVLLLFACSETFPRAETTDADAKDPRVGLDARPVSATCKAGPRPPAQQPGIVAFERVSGVTFEAPVDVVRKDGILYVLEQGGRMRRVEGDAAPTVIDVSSKIVSDGEAGLLGVAFHPRFSENGFVYLHYNVPYPTTPKPADVAFQSALVRYRSPDGGRTLDPASEKRIMTVDQPISNHTGGSIAFGNDGYLYWGLGDAFENAQNKSSLLGKILRIDVDGDPYRIPATNPFASGGGKPEIYAYGLRNPFRFRFDEIEGTLWAGDLGEAREEIDKIVLGGNYGWNVREGKNCYPATAACGTEGFIDPVVDHDRGDATSITGGVVYRGGGIPAITGTYVYGDFGTGGFWSIPINASAKAPLRLVDGSDTIRPSAFAIDATGEIVFTEYSRGRLLRMVKPAEETQPGVPERLSLTGCLDPAGQFPYEVNVEQWASGARAERSLAVPADGVIRSTADGRLLLPPGSVAMKTLIAGERRIETQLILARPGGVSDAYSYVWNEAQTDAILAEDHGACAKCHSDRLEPRGLEAAQLDRADATFGTRRGNPLVTLEALGMLDAPVPRERYKPLSRIDGYDAPDQRARSYLQASCSYCHAELARTLDPCVSPWIRPGKPEESPLSIAIAEARMPPIATRLADPRAVALTSEWIRSLRCR